MTKVISSFKIQEDTEPIIELEIRQDRYGIYVVHNDEVVLDTSNLDEANQFYMDTRKVFGQKNAS